MSKIVIKEEICKGCRYCMLACPRELIHINEDTINNLGYNPAHYVENQQSPCTGCALCAEICPDVLIEVYRDKKR